MTQIQTRDPKPQPRRNIAIVDDHAGFRKLISRVLLDEGYAANGFASVQEFVRSGLMPKIDCLILDVQMPGIDGLTLHETLKGTNFRFPVIICTGFEVEELHRELLASTTVLRKPVQPTTLIAAIEFACTPK